MRLWPIEFFPHLPFHQMMGQHRECCALRGKGWGRKHATVNYVFDHSYRLLFKYHVCVMLELINRDVMIDPVWARPEYRGRQVGFVNANDFPNNDRLKDEFGLSTYPEHNSVYIFDCLENLKNKGISMESYRRS